MKCPISVSSGILTQAVVMGLIVMTNVDEKYSVGAHLAECCQTFNLTLREGLLRVVD